MWRESSDKHGPLANGCVLLPQRSCLLGTGCSRTGSTELSFPITRTCFGPVSAHAPTDAWSTSHLGSGGRMLSRALIQRLQPPQPGSAGEVGELCLGWVGEGGAWSTGAAGLPAPLRAGPGLAHVSSGATLVVQRAAARHCNQASLVERSCLNGLCKQH